MAARYEELGLGEHVVLPTVRPRRHRHVYHLYMVRSQERDGLVSGLSEVGIGTAVYYSRPLHRQPVFAHLGHAEGSCR